MLALRKNLRELAWFEQQSIVEPNLTQFLDLVALGTVADIVPLEHCNRILVTHGMKRIRAGHCRPGIKALLSIANKELSRVQTSDLGFAIAPRLNAAGRLDDMSLGIECLLSGSETTALELANELDRLNKERREIQTSMQQQALDSLANLNLSGSKNSGSEDGGSEENEFALCLYQENWHQGIIGLLASKVKDKTYRPTIVFADADPDAIDQKAKLLKGSARSIPGVHIRDVLDTLATENPHLLNKFGGHAMAAGMTIEHRNLKEFTVTFNAIVKKVMSEQTVENVIWSDGELQHQQMTLSLARQLRDAGPWGQCFEEPCFHGDFEVISQRVLSAKHLKLELKNDQGKAFAAIAFFQEDSILNAQLDSVQIVYKIDVNFFRDQENLQLMIEEIFII